MAILHALGAPDGRHDRRRGAVGEDVRGGGRTLETSIRSAESIITISDNRIDR